MEQIKKNEENSLKLDSTIQDPHERNELVKKIIEQTPPEELTSWYLKVLTEYLVYPLEKKKD